MKLFNRAKFIGPMGLFVATAGGSARAAAPAEEKLAPTHCEGMDEASEQAHDKSTTHEKGEEKTSKKEEATHHGPVGLIGYGLSKICLSDEQRSAIEKLGKQVRPHEKKVMEARHELREELADQLRSGRIDEREVQDEIDELVEAREKASPVLRKALEDLHGLLDKGQRAALVDAIDKRMSELDAAAKHRWFDALAKDLELSDDQVTRVREVFAKGKSRRDEERQSVKAVFDAFRGDDFSMERIVPLAEVGKLVRERAMAMVGIAKELSAILTPEQREKLADRLEAKESKKHDSSTGRSAEEEDEEENAEEEESRGQSKQEIVVARGGYRAGVVRGWGGGGYAYGRRTTVVRTGYAGYPLVGGYAPGIW
jgi:Spy/CpxP family protein refolding chaperone